MERNDREEQLPEVVYKNMLHKCAYIIQKRWRRSWLHRKVYIQKTMQNNNLTSRCCQRFLYHQFNDKPTVSKFFAFLHAFFLVYKDHKLHPNIMEKILNGIVSVSGSDPHLFFCILNSIMHKPEQITIDRMQFSTLLSSFSGQIHNEMARFSLNPWNGAELHL